MRGQADRGIAGGRALIASARDRAVSAWRGTEPGRKRARERAGRGLRTLGDFLGLPSQPFEALRRIPLYRWLLLALVAFIVVWPAISVVSGLYSRLAQKIADPAGTADDIHKLLLGLAGLLAVPFLIWRTWTAHRQTQIAQESLYTGMFTKAVEQLGAMREVKTRPVEQPDGTTKSETFTETVPNTEVRLGAIYALERIAQDSERDHWPIMETLCAYVRKNAKPMDPLPVDVVAILSKRMNSWTKEETQRIQEERGKRVPYVDVQAALTVLGRRSPERRKHEERLRGTDRGNYAYRLDLMDCNLQGARLEGLNFDYAMFDRSDLAFAAPAKAGLTRARMTRACLQGAALVQAVLAEASLKEANLVGAILIACNLQRSQLQSANLNHTELFSAQLYGARLNKATLVDADMEKAMLIGAELTDANLKEATLGGADLTDAKLDGANFLKAKLWKAKLHGADLTNATNLTQAQIEGALGDAATKLPAGLSRPAGW